jgi:hypothetical protein
MHVFGREACRWEHQCCRIVIKWGECRNGRKQQFCRRYRRARTGRRGFGIEFVIDDRRSWIDVSQHHDGQWLHDFNFVTLERKCSDENLYQLDGRRDLPGGLGSIIRANQHVWRNCWLCSRGRNVGIVCRNRRYVNLADRHWIFDRGRRQRGDRRWKGSIANQHQPRQWSGAQLEHKSPGT